MVDIDRRQGLKGAAAAAASLLFGIPAASAQTKDLPDIPTVKPGSHPNLERVINAMGPQVDIFAFLDMDHGDDNLRAPLIDQKIQDRLKAHNVRRFGLELPVTADFAVQKLWNSQGRPADLQAFTGSLIQSQLDALKSVIKPDTPNEAVVTVQKDFIKMTHMFAGIIMSAKKAGVEVKAIDSQPWKEIAELLVTNELVRMFPHIPALGQKLSSLFDKRLSYDASNAARLIDGMKGGKAAYWFGGLHTMLQAGPKQRAEFGITNIDNTLRELGLRVGTVMFSNEREPREIAAIFANPNPVAGTIFANTGLEASDFYYKPSNDSFFQANTERYPIISPRNATPQAPQVPSGSAPDPFRP